MTKYIDKNGYVLNAVLWDGTDEAVVEIMGLFKSTRQAKSLRVEHGVLYGATGFGANIGDFLCRNRYGAVIIYTAEELEADYHFLGV